MRISGGLCISGVILLSVLCALGFFSKEEKAAAAAAAEEPELPKYRDRAKERREDQNPDYEVTELTSFHAVAPPGTGDIL